MEALSALGYECHGLNLVETADSSLDLGHQLSALRLYCEEYLQGRQPVLVAHGAAARKAQLYVSCVCVCVCVSLSMSLSLSLSHTYSH